MPGARRESRGERRESPGARQESRGARPNILFFFTDEHRLSALGCYGETPCETPHIDTLADEGVRFETAYTCCPVCTPARASFMTGLYPHAHGMTANLREILVEFGGLGPAMTLVTYRAGDIKYGWNVVTRDEMYDLAADPHEMRNLIDDPAYAATVREMRERLYAALDRIKHDGRGIFGMTRLGKPAWGRG